jgi:hypothetical protein
VGILLEHGADVHQRTSQAQSPLLAATAHDNPEIIQLLVEAGAEVGDEWMGLNVADAAKLTRKNSAWATLHAYESEFVGNILPTRNAKCVASVTSYRYDI